MATISSTQPTQTYLALPAPSAVRGARGGATGTTEPDYTELPPVAAVAPVARQPQNADAAQDDQGTGTGSTANQGAAGVQGQGQAQSQSQTQAQNQSNRPRVSVGSPLGQSSTGFVVQSLSQETVGSGLHIEPWQTALSSYRSAAALPASAASNRTSVTV